MKKFKDKNIIITGGAGGIGSEISEAFLKAGANVVIIGVNKKDINKKAKEFSVISKNIIPKCLDVSNAQQVKRFKTFIKTKLNSKVDILVNAAAIYGPMGPLEKQDLEFWEKTIMVNLIGTVNMCALVIPFMKMAGKGKIINFSGGGDGPFPYFTAYSSSKGAVLRFTESLSEELKKYKIFVNAIAPGAVNTGLLDEVLKAGKGKVGKEFYNISIKQKKSGGTPPGLAASLILFLSSSRANGLTGKMISAVWDDWKNIPKHLKIIKKSDIYNTRRVRPADRGYEWK